MPRIRTDSIKLVADGREIEIKNQRRGNFALNRALNRAEGWNQFKEDPAGFASRFGLEIDREISENLKNHIKDIDSLDEVRGIFDRGGDVSATVWAVASGAYSVTTSKIAVAF